jgi:hypothetical protein
MISVYFRNFAKTNKKKCHLVGLKKLDFSHSLSMERIGDTERFSIEGAGSRGGICQPG